MTVLFVLILATAECWAVQPYTPVQPDPVLEPWRWTRFAEVNGLGLQCLDEDRDGNIWFGVDEGAVRYDGVTWTTFTEKDGLYGGSVSALCGARDGSVYAGTPLGISRFAKGKWTRVFPSAGDLPWGINNLMEAKDGRIWAATNWGALRLGPEGPLLYTGSEMAAAVGTLVPEVSLARVPNAVVPAYPLGGSLFLWGKIGAAAIKTGRGPKAPAMVWALAPGGPAETVGLKVGDRLFFEEAAGDSVRLAVQRPGRSDPFEVIVVPGEIEVAFRRFSTNDIYEDRDGAMWFGLSREAGIARFDIRGAQKENPAAWRLYTEADGLNISYGERLIQTRDGTVWAISGDAFNGVNRFDGKGWTYFSLRDLGGTNNNTSILETRDGTLWIGGFGVLHALRDGEWRVYNPQEIGFPSHRARLLEASDGALWVAGLGQEATRLDYGTTRWTSYEGLVFQCETPDGAQWFLSEHGGVVRYDRTGGRSGASSGMGTWMRYGIEDGLMELPVRLFTTRRGELWAAGSQDSTAATARFDGTRWQRRMHPKLSWSINAVCEAADGSLYFGAAGGGGRRAERGYLGGLLRFSGKNWRHDTPPGPQGVPYGLAQSVDGTIWSGAFFGLQHFDGKVWTRVEEPEELMSVIQEVYAAPGKDLWAGTRLYGAFRYDGATWTRYDTQDGLVDNNIRSILQTEDGSVWVATSEGISRFDGQTWTTHALPADLVGRRVELRQSRDGAVWINSSLRTDFRTVRYDPSQTPPETEILVSLKEVSQPGNTVISWRGSSPWKATPEAELQYAFRTNGGEWSAFAHRTNQPFFSLSSGKHTFEVQARDRDFNVDPTPASIAFTVIPPVWQQPWFLGLMVVLLGGIGFQTGRVVRRDRRLQESNTALSSANKELFGLNENLQQKTDDLTVEAALERVRAKALGMQESDELFDVSKILNTEFESLGYVPFRTTIHVKSGESREWFSYSKGYTWREGEPTPSGLTEFRALKKLWEREERTESYQVYELSGKNLVEWYHVTKEGWAHPDEWFEEAMRDLPDRQAIHFVHHTSGNILLISDKRLCGADLGVVKRFADVFGLAYNRFLELQEKEAQNRELEEANRAMSDANKELFQANQALQRDGAVERIRGEVQAMDQASDFERVLSLLSEDLKTVGLSFDTCSIEVLGEPVDEPTMPYFEEHGFRYTAYTIDPDGTVTSNSYHIPAPFPPVVLETLERFVAGEPWQGTSGQTAIVEVPASNYGRLRITSSERQDFTEEDIESLQDFASAIALGYARYLDIREIQETTQRKSAFLASMSHDLRTPMNAIKGFTNLVLGRRSENLTERQRGNLEKVTQASDHLLAMINDLMDLSKIEAGQMDVNVSTFDVGHLVDYCISTVIPLVQEGVALDAEVDDGIGEAHTDEARLRRMLINLASNAIKFTDSGRVTVKARQEDEYLVLSVLDTGKGIPEDELATIFDEYRQVEGSDREHKGTGLGLSITKQFAELLGGSIGVESEVGKGSTFTVRVPVVYKAR